MESGLEWVGGWVGLIMSGSRWVGGWEMKTYVPVGEER